MRFVKKILLLVLVMLPWVAGAQYQPWAIQWLVHANTALNGRLYLGVTNVVPGTNITFTLLSQDVIQINGSGGGGTNSGPPGPQGPPGANGTNGGYFTQGANIVPTAAEIGGTVGSVTNQLLRNVGGSLMGYWSDGTTLWSKRLLP